MKRYIICLKFNLSVLLLVICLSSCQSAQLSQIEINESSTNNSAKTPNSSVQNINAANGDNKSIDLNQNAAVKTKIKSVYQTKSRRKNILFPEDCTSFVPAGDENWELQTNCAEAIQFVLPDLPRDGCGYEQFLKENSFNDFVKYSTDFHPGAVKFYSLSPNKYLVEVLCDTAAYNISNAYLLYDESSLPSKAVVLEFDSFEFTYDEDSDVAKTVKKLTVRTVGGRWFNPKTKELVVFIKARGIGDAGRYARYSFPNGKPKLEEFRAKFKWEGRSYQVDDVVKSAPKTWKKYYP
jgi:hypothetical protein